MTDRAPVVITASGPALSPGWCALNSAHVYRAGETVGCALRGGVSLGTVCPVCTRKLSS